MFYANLDFVVNSGWTMIQGGYKGQADDIFELQVEIELSESAESLDGSLWPITAIVRVNENLTSTGTFEWFLPKIMCSAGRRSQRYSFQAIKRG